jgi:hypothetical protein
MRVMIREKLFQISECLLHVAHNLHAKAVHSGE